MDDAHAVGGVAFRDVYQAEFPVVVRVLRRCGVAERHLEDAAQDVFAVVLRRRDSYDPARPVRPWLCGIATRVAADFRKRAAEQNEVVDAAPEVEASDVASRALDARQLLQRAMAAVSFDERVAVLLVDLEGHVAADVAHSLEIPVGTLYARLHSARHKLASALTRLGVTP